MAKRSRKIEVEKVVISPQEIKQKCRAAIKEKYGLNMRKFVESDVAKNLGIPKTFPSMIADSGSISFEMLSTLCSHLGIGKLEKETTRQVTYTLCEE